MERLLTGFQGDQLVTAALLFFSAEDILQTAREYFPHLIHARANDGGGVRISVTRAHEWHRVGTDGNFADRCLEILWTPGSKTVDGSSFAKTITGDGPTPLLYGRCLHSSWSRTSLPGFRNFVRGEHEDLGPHETAEASVKALPDWAR